MISLSHETIKETIADSTVIYMRGVDIHENGYLLCTENSGNGTYRFRYDGDYGEYEIAVDLSDDASPYACDCPYPGEGCKHVVASLLTVLDYQFAAVRDESKGVDSSHTPVDTLAHMDRAEIRAQAMEDREKRAKNEFFDVVLGDMYKDVHLVTTRTHKSYTVVLHDPETGAGHCNCPDFLSNQLGACKHLLFLTAYVKTQKNFKKQVDRERFPLADIYWDSRIELPRLFYDRETIQDAGLLKQFARYFDDEGRCTCNLVELFPFIQWCSGRKKISFQFEVLRRVNLALQDEAMMKIKASYEPDYSMIKTTLYDYQKQGVDFGLFLRAVLIGDEMGLGKTLQAIALSLMKKEIFGFKNVLIVTLASLKEQWKREIGKFTDAEAVIVSGSPVMRKEIYRRSGAYFKITNYEAVLRDVTIISEMKPDIVILDEAQRIKNFNTKTADAVKQLPREHAIVLTGTPLENKLEDVYSIVQFLDPTLLSPLWDFASRYFMMLRKPKGKINGYTNLLELKQRLSHLVIRRKKEDVLKDLPETTTNNYYIDLTEQQEKMHAGFKTMLIPLLSKKYLTPVEFQRIQMLLLKMRQACNSTYLIDKKTNLSPKLKEFESIIQDLVCENGRKVVVFSEWTGMTFLIARSLSKAGISFVELSGKIPVKKRQKLIDEFTNNPDCRVFLSTDAGGTGLNLQAADCVINFELPWNPARLKQRTGRVNRIGQKSQCINVINLISKRSIEENILSGLELKLDLFKGVFEDGDNMVDFSSEKRTSLLNRLREMMGETPDAMPRPETGPTEDISEDTPFFLNPKALNDEMEEESSDTCHQEDTIDIISEETASDSADTDEDQLAASSDSASQDSIFEGQSAEKIEAVLNSGMEFIGGLLEMATGKKIEAAGSRDKMLSIDRDTGEVTMKFRLPGM